MINFRNLIYFICLLFIHNIVSQNSFGSPNFIFILADDQGWNGTSVEMISGLSESKSDFYETPNIEKLAYQGIKFSYANRYVSSEYGSYGGPSSSKFDLPISIPLNA